MFGAIRLLFDRSLLRKVPLLFCLSLPYVPTEIFFVFPDLELKSPGTIEVFFLGCMLMVCWCSSIKEISHQLKTT